MQTLIATTNPATLNFAEAILKAEGIPCFILDEHQSIVDGSIGIIPRRLAVLPEDYDEAVKLLRQADLDKELFEAG